MRELRRRVEEMVANSTVRLENALALKVSTKWLAGGFTKRESQGKHRFAAFLGSTFWRKELQRRCVVLGDRTRAAEASWYSPENRWGRGIGFGWKRLPESLLS